MTVTAAFWFLAGALSATAVMLLFGGPLRALRSQSRWMLAGSAAALLGALALYLRLGTPAVLLAPSTAGLAHGEGGGSGASAGTATASGVSGATGSADAAGSMDAAVASLEARLRAKGGGDADWELLARSYEFLNRADAAALARARQLPPAGAVAVVKPGSTGERLLATAEAARLKRDFAAADKAYAQLAASGQMTADAWANYADVAASLNRNSLAGRSADYLRNALRLDPVHPKALWLQASLEHETRQHAAAIVTWNRLLALMDPASGDAKLIRANIEEDRKLQGGAPAPATAAPAAAMVTLRGEVTVAKALQGKVKPGQVLYIVAKSVNSPGMPLAVRRVQTGQWPLAFELSDSDAMVPERRLSTLGPVTIEARISQSGVANAAAGDLLGATASLDPLRAPALRIVIDRELR